MNKQSKPEGKNRIFENKMTLYPMDYTIFRGGLKIENVGDKKITVVLPKFFEIEPVEKS